MLSVRSSLKAPHSLRLIHKSQREKMTTKGKLPPKVENMVFEYILLLIVENNRLLKFLDNIVFLDILDMNFFGYFGYCIFWIRFKLSLIFNFQNMRMMMGATRRDLFD